MFSGKWRWILISGVFLLVLAACGTATESVTPTASAPSLTATSPAADESAATVSPTLPRDRSLMADQNDFFATAATCDACHQNLQDAAGRDISPAENWRATMMANAAIDPYYLASVSIEVAAEPEQAEIIQDTCSTCHMPLAHFTDLAEGKSSVMFGADGYLSPDHPLHTLAVDGVSCTACHQIPENPRDNFRHNGDLSIDLTTPRGTRVLYGPYPVDEVGQMIMQAGSGFTPQESKHIRQSSLCANCHELYIPALDEHGEFSGELFPEQTPYLEWLHSDYVGQASCQSCHMSRAQGKVAVSNLTADKKYPHFSIHDFHGSNLYLLNILKTFGDEIGVRAEDAHFDALLARTEENLQQASAAIALDSARLEDGVLRFDVHVENKAGHKFPTSFPSRRAWLHVIVTDANGRVVFESGAPSADGSIAGNANDEDPLAYEPHYDEISSADQVQIYESIMRLPDDTVTTMQMRAVGYIKDNRLLPTGFDKANADDYIAVIGAAAADANFIGGQDTVSYRIDVSDAAGPLSVRVEFLYQSVSYRWIENLRDYDTEQVSAFLRYTESVENTPFLVGSAELSIP